MKTSNLQQLGTDKKHGKPEEILNPAIIVETMGKKILSWKEKMQNLKKERQNSS